MGVAGGRKNDILRSAGHGRRTDHLEGMEVTYFLHGGFKLMKQLIVFNGIDVLLLPGDR